MPPTCSFAGQQQQHSTWDHGEHRKWDTNTHNMDVRVCIALSASCRVFFLVSDYVTYPISSTVDEVESDSFALNQYTYSCEYYKYKPYACSKFFPRCVNGTDGTAHITRTRARATRQGTISDGLTHDSHLHIISLSLSFLPSLSIGVSTELKICQDYCLGGERNADCARAFVTSYFETECAMTAYYTSSEPCVGADLIGLPPGSDNSLWWKVGLGSGLGVLGCVMMGWIYRRHRYENATEAEIEQHDAKKAAQRAKKRQKADRKNGVASAAPSPRAANGRGVPPSDSPSTPDLIDVADIELAVPPPRDHSHDLSHHAALSKDGSASTGVASSSGAAAAAIQKSSSRLTQQEKDAARASRPLLEQEGHPRTHPTGESQVESPISRLEGEQPEGVQLHAHMLYGDEDAWKTGQIIRVAPPPE